MDSGRTMDEKMKSFKGRTLDYSKKVKVYRNLHNGLLSIMQDGLIVAHANTVRLKDVSFVVQQGGHLKAVTTKTKNVHAFVIGYVTSDRIKATDTIHYNPYKANYFRDSLDNKVNKAKLIKISSDGWMSVAN